MKGSGPWIKCGRYRRRTADSGGYDVRWGMRVTLPALMHDVQTCRRRGVPSTKARTFWMFGFQRRLFRLCENVTALPKNGFFPQTSHTAAIGGPG